MVPNHAAKLERIGGEIAEVIRRQIEERDRERAERQAREEARAREAWAEVLEEIDRLPLGLGRYAVRTRSDDWTGQESWTTVLLVVPHMADIHVCLVKAPGGWQVHGYRAGDPDDHDTAGPGEVERVLLLAWDRARDWDGDGPTADIDF